MQNFHGYFMGEISYSYKSVARVKTYFTAGKILLFFDHKRLVGRLEVIPEKTAFKR